MPSWRDILPANLKARVNPDGKFLVRQTDGLNGALSKCFRNTPMYPVMLWLKGGIGTYLSDTWNLVEFVSYVFFCCSFIAKVLMTNEASKLYEHLPAVLAGTATTPFDLERFAALQNFYMMVLAPNCILMWIKLLKFIDVVPQLGLLINILSAAGPPVLIFAVVAMIPVIGFAQSFHVHYGASLSQYSSGMLSFNTLMRLSLGDFDFDQLKQISSFGTFYGYMLFWMIALLLNFVLVNIFVAIILDSYAAMLKQNPAANDSSKFIAMVIMTAKKGVQSMIEDEEPSPVLNPHVIESDLPDISGEEFWDIFEGYFREDAHLAHAEHEDDEPDEEAEVQPSGGGAAATMVLTQDGAEGVEDEVKKKNRKNKKNKKNKKNRKNAAQLGESGLSMSMLSTKVSQIAAYTDELQQQVSQVQESQSEIIRMLKQLSHKK